MTYPAPFDITPEVEEGEIIQTLDECKNIRFIYTKCFCIHLRRCHLHKIIETNSSCACPNPRTTFQSYTIAGECPDCERRTARHAYGAEIGILLAKQDALHLVRRKNIKERVQLRTVPHSKDRMLTLELIAARNEVIDSISRKTHKQIADLRARSKATDLDILSLRSVELKQEAIGLCASNWVNWFTGEWDRTLWKWTHQDGELLC